MFTVSEYQARVPALDGVRGLAILMVLIWHYAINLVELERGSIGYYALALLRHSWSGVDLFFVLSGFLIGGILIDQRKSQNYFGVFYIRRACRIVPLYFLWLALFFAMAQSIGTPNAAFAWLFDRPLPLASYLTFTQNFVMAWRNDFGAHWLDITWSLAVEEQFYLILPFIVRFIEPRKLPWVLGGLILMAPLLRLAIYLWNDQAIVAVYVLAPCRADSLLLGVLCAWAVRQHRIARFLVEQPRPLYAAFGILLLGVIALTLKFPFLWTPGMFLFGYSWLALFYASLLLIVVTQRGPITAAFSALPLRQLGIIAYGLYLIHHGILGLCHALMLNQAPKIRDFADVIVTLIALAITIGLSVLSWRFLEKPLVRAGHTLRYATIAPR
jgi:peptidoglycan/LPS O-acetylase OafA/YrhL